MLVFALLLLLNLRLLLVVVDDGVDWLVVMFTLCVLKADKVASDPSPPPGLGVGPQQFTGRPAIGSGLFCCE